jgi:ABC-type transport system involved in cytochrome c biogenesis permease subunit
MKKFVYPFLLLTSGVLLPVPSLRAEVSPKALETIVVQDGGRRKPYLVFAEETLRSLAGKTSLMIDGKKIDAMPLITSIWMDPEAGWKAKELILVSNRPLKQEAGLDPARKLFSHRELTANGVLAAKMDAAAKSRRMDPRAKLAGMEKEAADVGLRMALLEALEKGEAYRIIPPESGPAWGYPGPGDELMIRMKEGWDQGNLSSFHDSADQISRFQAASGMLPSLWKIRLEVLYQKAHPFRWAWILYAGAGIVLLVSRGAWEGRGYGVAWILATAGFLLQAAGLASRVLIAGRPPVTNMYESVIWVAFGTILFALIFEAVYRARVFLLGAVPVAVASLILADSQPMILDRSIHPLTPVLRDNFWLTTHVLSITLSYAAFALALGVAHVALAGIIAGRKPSAGIFDYLYRTLQVGVLLLATGTILGGVWANYSWGRFWDWDPKETWALIALLGYLFLLHGRISGMWGGFGLAVGSVLAFLSVLMAWYWVNFVLGAGLHSYGFGTGGFPLVATYVGLELLFLGIAVLKGRGSPLPQ